MTSIGTSLVSIEGGSKEIRSPMKSKKVDRKKQYLQNQVQRQY